MTSRPELATDVDLFPGLVAGGLFVVLAVLILGATFTGTPGFPEDARITATIGYALFNLEGGSVPSAGFLAAFEIIDVVLVAALVVAVMLARRTGDSRGGER